MSIDSILSHAKGALLPFFTTRDANSLRLVCHEFLDCCTSHPWEDEVTVVKGSLAKWRVCFPLAKAANVGQWQPYINPLGRKLPLKDADFVFFKGIRTLNIFWATCISDAAFEFLRGSIHTLKMEGCRQPGITDLAFQHIKGVKILNMSFCYQESITDSAFSNLRGITSLDMEGCNQSSITGAAFANLKDLRRLNLRGCRIDQIQAASSALGLGFFAQVATS